MTGGDALPAEPVSPLRQVIGVLQILLVLACVALLRVWHKRRQAAAAREEAEAREAARRSRQVGDISLQTLSMHDGMDPTKQILLAVEGTVYDVSRGRSTYGPGGCLGPARHCHPHCNTRYPLATPATTATLAPVL